MDNYNILSLDGGGIRGLILLKQLIVLEKMLGCPLYKKFDLISGTSTGGIIAVLLSLGYSCEELLDLYLVHGKNIFKRKWYRFGIFRPKYSDKYFNEMILNYVGNKTLKDTITDILITGYNATKNDKILFKSRKAKVDDNYNYSLYDVLRSTTSAPTFFRPHYIEKEQSHFVDGGLVINNPALISWIEALEYTDYNDKINILSFSTGSIELPIKKKVIGGGKLNWVGPTVDILLTEQTQTTDYHLEKIYNNREIGLYIRCNSILEKSSGEMDDTSIENVKNMLHDGNISAKNNFNLMKQFWQYL